MNWKAFWRGFGSLTVFPPPRPAKRFQMPRSDAESIRGDWEMVGKDLRKAMDSEKQKSSPRDQGIMASAMYGMTSADALCRDQCPFPEGSKERAEWLAGWDAETNARRVFLQNAKTEDNH